MTFPARQFMISHNTVEKSKQNHQRILEYCQATSQDIVMEDIEETYPYEKERGFQCRYKLEWFTKVGWKSYMMHTGALVSIEENQ